MHEKKQLKKEAYDKVLLARHPDRPGTRYYLKHLLEDFIELKGDRLYGEDPAIVGGVGLFLGQPVTVIGHVKGKATEENIRVNFGMPHPEGYRKAMRLALAAEKFNRPILTFIDTPGAYPGVGAEERGQSEAIARCLMTFMGLKVPVIAVIIGEGGSGGALAIGGGNHVIMLENSVYSVLSPEGFSSILYKDPGRAREAAELMKLTAKDLLAFGVIDEIVGEPAEGAQNDPDAMIPLLKTAIHQALGQIQRLGTEKLPAHRQNKFKKMGSMEP